MITFSVITPVHDPPVDILRETIESVLSQSFPYWELCLVDDGSKSPEVRQVLHEYAAADDRVKVVLRETSGGISRASNDGIAVATGDFVAFLDHDDLLARDALAANNHEIAVRDHEVDYCYSDEAVLFPDGMIGRPFYKPDWSPERMRSQMYTCHLAVMRRSLVIDVGGFRPEFDGSQDYDLVLRLTERTDRVVHVPEVLYFWRIVPGSAAGDVVAKPYAIEAARRAVQEHCDRTGINATVETMRPGLHRLRRRVDGEPLVSVVIPTRGGRARVDGEDRAHLLHALSSLLDRSTYTNLELVIVADRETPDNVLAEAERIGGDRLRVEWFDGPFNFSRKINAGVAAATGEFLLLLNDDVEIVSPDWIEVLIALAQAPDCGLVGCKLLYADGTLQHGGHVYAAGAPFHICRGFPGDAGGMAGLLQIDRECSGVTAACVALRREVFNLVGGMCERLPVNFNDVDFSLKIRHLGYRVVWTPHAVLRHFESLTRIGFVEAWELEMIRQRWGTVLERDPYFNPNLDPLRWDWVVQKPPEAWFPAADRA